MTENPRLPNTLSMQEVSAPFDTAGDDGPSGHEGTYPNLKTFELAVGYGNRPVVRDVELGLQRGDCLAITGPNGSGKSTLVRALAGLVRPLRGAIELMVSGPDPIRLTPNGGDIDRLMAHVGLAAPEIQLYDELTAAENLLFFARLRGLPERGARVLDGLDEAALRDRADVRLGSFSSGMKQRIRLLFASQHNPAILLLDEPGSNLDAPGREFVRRMVERQLRGGIVVLATNDPTEVELGTQVLRLEL